MKEGDCPPLNINAMRATSVKDIWYGRDPVVI